MIEFPALGYCPLPGINRSESLARFEGFELNPRTGELRKNGDALVRLSQQPLRILLTLLETPGELVAREDLRKRLWPNDTVVEFEHSINAAIKRLRQALGDSAENPVFIETLARRGYRWKTPVQWMEPAVESSTGAIGPTWTLTGQRVSHYRVLELLGGGGMGLVYKAEDLKLGRRVALKFLPAELVRDPVSLERFRREARAASVPDHPNICTIYEVGEYEGAPFIAMQLLRGQALNERIEVGSHRPIGFDEILRIGIQVADGLEAAHREGIIHRDIKPANIFITERGEAKILDFGLAKLMDVDDRNRIVHEALDFELGSSNLSLTHIGAAVGTASYMSPEQIRGQKLDARSDLFSLGLVLYEMSTGKRAFSGDSSTDVHNAVLHSVPASVRSLNSELPSEFQLLIEKSLSKDRESRYQSASELRSELERLRQKFGSRHYPQSAQMVRRLRPILYIGLLALLLFVLFRVFRGGTVPSVADLKLTQLTWNSGELPVRTAAISPDGRYLAYTDLNGIHVKILSTNETRTVPQPDSLRGSSRVDWAVIGWFPDGTRFVAQIAAFGEGCIDCDPFSTWVVSTLGDAPRKIHDQSAAEAVSPDGSLIAYTAVLGKPGGREIWVMNGAGGHSRKLFETDRNSWFRDVNWSPDGQRLAYIHVREAPGQNSTFESRPLNGGPPIPILTNINADALQDFVWLPDGNIVYGLGESRGNGCNYWKLWVDTRTRDAVKVSHRRLHIGEVFASMPLPLQRTGNG